MTGGSPISVDTQVEMDLIMNNGDLTMKNCAKQLWKNGSFDQQWWHNMF